MTSTTKVPGDKRKSATTPAAIIEWFDDRAKLVAESSGNLWIVPVDSTKEPLRASNLERWIIAELVCEGSNPSVQSVKNAVTALTVRASQTELPQTKVYLRVARAENGIAVDLGQRGSSACVVVTQDGWEVRRSFPERVTFERPPSLAPLPMPERGGTLDELQDILDLPRHQWLLTKGWMVVSALPDIARPLLNFVGTNGSGKSTRAKCVVSVLDPTEELVSYNRIFFTKSCICGIMYSWISRPSSVSSLNRWFW